MAMKVGSGWICSLQTARYLPSASEMGFCFMAPPERSGRWPRQSLQSERRTVHGGMKVRGITFLLDETISFEYELVV